MDKNIPAHILIPKKRKYKKEDMRLLYLAIPFIIFIFMFSYVPLFGWSLVFFQYRPGMPFAQVFSENFVGLQYFRWMFTTELPEIRRVMTNTMALAGLGLLFSPLSMILAMLLNEVRNMPFRRVVQTLTTLPNFVSWVIIFALAFAMFSTEGAVNQMLMDWGLIDRNLRVLDNSAIVWRFQTALGIWRGVGWGAIIYIAAITGIDQEQYEAATVDGAGRFRRAIHITLPGLLPTYFVLLLLGIGSILSPAALDQTLNFHNGLVARRIETLDYYTYMRGIVNQVYSYAIAVGMLRSFISVILLFSANYLSKIVRGHSIF